MSSVVLCPKCGNSKLAYSPGIDIGLMHAICINCGYKDNESQFPKLTKRQAAKIKVIKGKSLEKLQAIHASRRTASWWTGLIAILVISALFLAFIL